MDKPCKLYRWAKGPRVLLIPEAGTGTVYMEMIVNCGSFMDPASALEVSHVLEHMQGNFTSVKYPCARTIRLEFRDHGCTTNASTHIGKTRYYITSLRGFFKARQDTSPEKFADFYSDPVSLGQPRLTYTRLYHAYLTISPRDILQASKDILKCPRLVVYSE